MTTLYLIRHAQAEGNLYRRCHGWQNGLITPKGYLQAAALERRFSSVPIHAVYSSDLYRTMITAGAIFRPRSLPLRLVPSLREINGGRWENRPWGDLLYHERDSLIAFLQCRPNWQVEGSETFPQVRERIQTTVESLAAAHDGQTIAIISHGNAIRCGLSSWLELPADQLGTLELGDNTSVAKLEYSGGHMKVIYYNDNSHLGDLAFQRQQTGLESDDDEVYFASCALRFEPLRLPEQSEFYLSCRTEGWLASHGTMEHFDGEHFLAAALESSAHAKDSVLLALIGDTPVGILHMDWGHQAESGVGRVSFLYTAPEFRSMGFGAQLLGQALSDYRAQGRQYLRLRCAPENERAKQFYISHGFYKVGEEAGGIGHLDLMEKYIGIELR